MLVNNIVSNKKRIILASLGLTGLCLIGGMAFTLGLIPFSIYLGILVSCTVTALIFRFTRLGNFLLSFMSSTNNSTQDDNSQLNSINPIISVIASKFLPTTSKRDKVEQEFEKAVDHYSEVWKRVSADSTQCSALFVKLKNDYEKINAQDTELIKKMKALLASRVGNTKALPESKPYVEEVDERACLKDALRKSYLDNLDGYDDFILSEELLKLVSVKTQQIEVNTQRINEITAKLEEHHRIRMQSAIDYMDESMAKLAKDQSRLISDINSYSGVKAPNLKIKVK